MPNTSSTQSSHFIHLTCLDALIAFFNNGNDVNQVDENGNTVLHATIFYNKDNKEKNEPMIKHLLEKGADANKENLFGETPLYVAIWHSNDIAVNHLLKAGAGLLFRRENALHLAAEVGYVPNVKLLLASDQFQENSRELVNALDYDGYSPAYRAALTGHKFSLKYLALAGADLSFKVKDRTIMEVIFEEITRPEDWFVDLLDEGITCEVDAQKHSYVVDMKVLAPETNERQLEVLVDLIGAANLQEENVVLQHPLIEFLLILKWAKLCYFYYYVLVTYTIFALSLSLYGSSLNRMIGGCAECDEGFEIGINIYRVIAIISGFLIFLHVGLQCILNPKKFLKFDNFFTMVSLCVAILIAVVGENFAHLRESEKPDWVLQIISVLLLFLWMELMSLLGRLPALGYYAIMFITVLKNVLSVLSIFVCLLLGFALSFSIQFHNSPQFSDPWKALVKTTVMMAGEFEYSDLYANRESDNTYSLILSRFIFLMFIVLSSIVLMNLMIALAASDIQALQVQSHARKMKKQAYFLFHMEKVILCKQLTASYVPSLIARFLRSRRHVRTRYEFTKSMRGSRYLPTTLIEHIKRIGKEHKKIVT